MATEPLTLLDELSEALILADVTNLPALAAIHSHFKTLELEMTHAEQMRAARAARAAALLVEQVILGETDDAPTALCRLTLTVSGLLTVYREGAELEDAALPVLGDGSPQPALAKNPLADGKPVS
jgi:hypothetical protein